MKKICLALLAAACLAACSNDSQQPPEPPTPPDQPDKAALELSAQSVQIPRAGGSLEVAVTANYQEWDFQCDDAWLSVQKTQSGLTLSAEENSSSQRNHATVTVTVTGEGDDNSASATIDVFQNDGALVIEIDVPAGTAMTAPLMGAVNCTIDWGDGESEDVQANIDGLFTPSPTHAYTEGGTYEIRISGQVERIGQGLSFPAVNRPYITRILQWGNLGLLSLEGAFYGCENLREIPGDADGSFTETVNFRQTFSECSSLTTLPADLFAYADKAEDFPFCFSNSGITEIPEGFFDNCTSARNMISLFSRCPIISIPDRLFSSCEWATNFSSVFYGCVLLQSIPENLFEGCVQALDFSSSFRECQSLTEIPENLFAASPAATRFSSAFIMCYSLMEIPENLFAGNPEAENFIYCFTDCTSLTSIPAGLFDNNRKVTNFGAVFRGCYSVRGESPYTVIDGNKVHLYERSKYPSEFMAPQNYEYCFSDCSGLSDYEYMEQNYPEWAKTYIKS